MIQTKTKCAAVYKRGEKLLFHSSSETTAGVLMASPPHLVIDSNSSEEVIGETVLKVLSASKTKVPHPTDWKAVERPILEMAGVTSWAKFMKGTVSCDVDQEGDILKFIPDKNSGPREGFIPQEALAIKIPVGSSPCEIGATLLEALRQSV